MTNPIVELANIVYSNASEPDKAAIRALFALVSSVAGSSGTLTAVSDEITPLVEQTALARFRAPFAMTITAVRASLTTAQVSGSKLTIDVNAAGASVLSTKLTFDNGEKTTTTASVQAVISTSTIADDAEITFDVDQVGSGEATGLKVTLFGYKT